MRESTGGQKRHHPTLLHAAAPPAPGARAHLRAATAALHGRAEQVVALDDIRDLARYRQVLAGFGAVHAALAASRPECGPGRGPETVPAEDMARLCADLACLGLAAPAPARGLQLGSPAGQLGVRYVVEGSRLGGRVIARRLKARLGLDRDRGAAFFDLDARATAARWQRFCEELEQGCASPAERAEATDGARRAFRLFLDAFAARPRRDAA